MFLFPNLRNLNLGGGGGLRSSWPVGSSSVSSTGGRSWLSEVWVAPSTRVTRVVSVGVVMLLLLLLLVMLLLLVVVASL